MPDMSNALYKNVTKSNQDYLRALGSKPCQSQTHKLQFALKETPCEPDCLDPPRIHIRKH